MARYPQHFAPFPTRANSRFLVSIILFWVLCSPQLYVHAAEAVAVEANVTTEISFTAKGAYRDPFNEVLLDVIFTAPNGRALRVPGFWAGGDKWKVRYSSPLTGKHSYRTECNVKTDSGLDGMEGNVEVVPYRGQNPLFKHGPIQIAADHRHFQYSDGTPFFWLGDTWWMGLSHRLKWPDEFKLLTADRVTKGFNVVQIVAGLYPDMPPFDPRGANEAGFPWETNYARIRPEYFDAVDLRLNHLANCGISPCLVGSWGYFIPWMGVEKAKQHWRYLIARYGALPIFWCAAGEANLPYYLVKGFPFDDRQQVKDWTEVMRYIRQIDAFHRPLSIHPTGLGKLSARGAVEDQSLLDFDMLQTGHGMREVLAPTVKTMRDSYAAKPVMPVLNSEVCFEMLGDNIPAEIPRLMFWASVLSGAAGHTYGANGIWQCNRPGDPHGASPHGGNYGKITWEDAMDLPGSQQVGLGKKFLERFDWMHFEPCGDWVAWADAEGPRTWGKWIWFPEGDPKRAAPVEARFFRRAFDIPESAAIKRARLTVAADDRFQAWVNGAKVGSGESWSAPRDFDVKKLLAAGRNVLAIRAENAPAPVTENPAGLIASLDIELESGRKLTMTSDESWSVSKVAGSEWTGSKYDASNWSKALVTAKYGEAPWGKIGGNEPAVVPFAVGISNRLLVVYSPDARSIRVSHLAPGAKYRLGRFDPVTGEHEALPEAQSSHEGDLILPPPAYSHDWVATMKAER
jgi:hypothetical protein